MVCTRLSQLLNYEIRHYNERIDELKREFDNLNGFDNDRYLIERHFQKTLFNHWAQQEKKAFCKGCDANGGCDMKF